VAISPPRHGRNDQVSRSLCCRDDGLTQERAPVVTAFIKNATFDSADPLALAAFWAAALGSNVDEDSTPERAFVEAPGWGGPNIWFVRVPEPKTAKNRLHFDLRAMDTIEQEVTRLQALGATVVSTSPGLVAMQDPEGNEFCVE
jgi:hypothetical protein